mmetsp:Transcript_65539/g.158030  ORF Transcript_65539/g.158030 Transcript_65539/m.158030 type:complete len:219 (-) Transcript_65539:261-917(-)
MGGGATAPPAGDALRQQGLHRVAQKAVRAEHGDGDQAARDQECRRRCGRLRRAGELGARRVPERLLRQRHAHRLRHRARARLRRLPVRSRARGQLHGGRQARARAARLPAVPGADAAAAVDLLPRARRLARRVGPGRLPAPLLLLRRRAALAAARDRALGRARRRPAGGRPQAVDVPRGRALHPAGEEGALPRALALPERHLRRRWLAQDRSGPTAHV